MKNLLLILILGCSCSVASSQSSFIINDIQGPELSAFSDVQFSGGKYYFLSIHTEYVSPWKNFGVLYIFDEGGLMLNSYLLGGYGHQYFKILDIQANQIRLLGSLETDSCNSILVLSKLNLTNGSLEVLEQQPMCHDDDVIKRLTFFQGFDDQILIEGGYGARITNNIDHSTFVVSLDTMGQFKTIFDPTDFPEAHLSIDFSEKGYVLKDTYMTDFYDTDFNWRKRRMNYLDGYYLNNFAYSQPFGNKYLLDQAEISYDEGYGQAIRLIDSNLYIRKEAIIAPAPNQARPTSFPLMGGIDVVNDSMAWVASNFGTEYFIGYPYFTITKVDDELNILCQQYIGFDAFYEIYGLLAIENNGVVIYGWKKPKEEPLFSELQDVYAIKLGENCELVTSTENHLKPVYTISAFPNPTFNSLTFNVTGFDPSTLTIEIYNTAGITLFSKQDLSNEIEVRNLPSGQYFYRILQGEKLLGVGSWIKQ